MRTPPKQRRPVPGRAHRHVVRVTADEEALLIRRADEAGVTVARWLAECGLGNAPTPLRRVVTGELFAVRRQLQGLATNVNQLAASANSGVFVSDDQVHDVLDQWAAMVDRINAVIEAAASA